MLPTVYPEFLEKFRELRSAKRFRDLNLIEEAKKIAELKGEVEFGCGRHG